MYSTKPRPRENDPSESRAFEGGYAVIRSIPIVLPTDLMSDDIFFLSSFRFQNDGIRLYNYNN